MGKYKIIIDFDGMKDQLDQYNGKIIDAINEDDASKQFEAILDKNGVDLTPYYACIEENE